MKIDHYIRQWREKRGMTQAELARKAGLSRTSTNRIEAGRQRPSLDNFDRIARALDVTVYQLQVGADEPATDQPPNREDLSAMSERASDDAVRWKITSMLATLSGPDLSRAYGVIEGIASQAPGKKNISQVS